MVVTVGVYCAYISYVLLTAQDDSDCLARGYKLSYAVTQFQVNKNVLPLNVLEMYMVIMRLGSGNEVM